MRAAKRRWLVVVAAITVACGASYLAHFADLFSLRPDVPRGRPAADSGGQRRLALLVGCGRYKHPSIRPLEGPVNDVGLLKKVLVERCGFSPYEITTLAGDARSSDAPTRNNIEREFRRLQALARKGDQVVVLLAGHGSQQPNEADDLDDFEADGLDEIFLPIDAEPWSSAGGEHASGGVVNAVIDDEIYHWAAGIADQGATVWMIFDCCCAGTAVRGGYQETARFVSASADLMVPEAGAAKTDLRRNAPAAEGEAAPWQELRNDRIVALYACQAHESELELALPPSAVIPDVARVKHGLLTYALCCALSEPGSEMFTCRELVRDIWLRYRAWGRAAPTPFADGAIDRQVFGEHARNKRFRIVGRSGREYRIDAGSLQGLVPGSIVAVYSSAAAAAGGNDRPSGYARVTRVEVDAARIVPCAYRNSRQAARIDVGAWCELEFADFGDLRIRAAIDGESLLSAGRSSAALARLSAQLRALARAPDSVFKVVDDCTAADWVIQARQDSLQLLPKSAAALAEGEPPPLGAPCFAVAESNSAQAAAGILQRVFRAQNLIRLASGPDRALPRSGNALKVKVELLSQSNPLADGAVLVDGQQVEWKITNEGTGAIDLTLLFIDSRLSIKAAYPQPGEFEDNRLAPGKSLRLEAEALGDTLGAEYLITIAARGRGPQRDYRCLAEPSLAAARRLAGAVRGPAGEDVLQSPFGRLMRYALYGEEASTGAIRGLAASDADDCSLTLRAWIVKPK